MLVLYFEFICCESDYDQELTPFYNMKCFQNQKDCVIFQFPEELREITGENEVKNFLSTQYVIPADYSFLVCLFIEDEWTQIVEKK